MNYSKLHKLLTNTLNVIFQNALVFEEMEHLKHRVTFLILSNVV